MATNCGSTAASARRLSDLLQEQQEPPFLLLHLLLQDHDDDDSATPARTPAAAARRSLLRGSTAATVTKLALRWADDVLAGCFRLRRLPRPDRDTASAGRGGAVDCGRHKLSPVSVLDLRSDDESSPVPSHRDEHSGDDGNGRPSTSGAGVGTSPSPPSIHDDDQDLPGKSGSTEDKFQRKSVVCAWECDTVAADIFRIPSHLEHDLSGSPRDDWRRLVAVGREEESRRVAQSVEAMIFEEVRWEAVRDMLCSPQH